MADEQEVFENDEALALFIVNAWEGSIVGARAAKNGASFAAFFHIVFDRVPT